MTQHHYKTEYKGEEVRVVAGWDRTCRGFFMHIEHEISEEKDPIYCNLNEVDSFPKTFHPFIVRLAEHEIELPQAIVSALVVDKVVDRGNTVTHWGPDGIRLKKQ